LYSSRSKVSAAKLRNAKSSSTMANFNTTQLGQNTLFFDDFKVLVSHGLSIWFASLWLCVLQQGAAALT
jgi:hypothetical protein